MESAGGTSATMTSNLDLLHDVLVHALGNPVNVVLTVVVHHGIGEHEHHVPLKLSRCADRSTLYVPLDGLHVQRSVQDTYPTGSQKQRHRNTVCRSSG